MSETNMVRLLHGVPPNDHQELFPALGKFQYLPNGYEYTYNKQCNERSITRDMRIL